MSKYKKPGVFSMFSNAFKGIRLALKSERNTRIHFIVAITVLFLGCLLHFTPVEFCFLIIAIALVIIAEMVNSAIEFALDAVFRNRYSKMVVMAKDISAGAVMLATICSVVVGILLFGGKILMYFIY